MLRIPNLPQLGLLLAFAAFFDVAPDGGCDSCDSTRPYPPNPEPHASATAMVRLEVYAEAQQSCPIDGASLALGQGTPLVDGQGSATVSCSLESSAGELTLSGSVLVDSNSFSFAVPFIQGTQNGTLSFKLSSGGGVFAATDQTPCTFTIPDAADPSAPLSFSCPAVVNMADNAQTCAVRMGTLTFDNCDPAP
jgi:hypothetical protein